MEGRLIIALLVCLALTEYGLGEEMTRRDEIQEDNPVSLQDGISEDEILKIFLDRTSTTHTKLKKILLKSAGKLNGSIFRNFETVGSPANFQANGRSKQTSSEVSQPCRVRKEFLTGLTKEERAHYIKTVKTAASTEPYKTIYEELLTKHRTLFDDLHKESDFLPWHRWLILEYENILREIDSKITVPYWDWSLVANELFTNDFWATDESGFGGNGNSPGRCVDTGPFREGEFSLIQSAGGGCLRRKFNNFAKGTPDALAVRILLLNNTAENFSNFEMELRDNLHNNVHSRIGSTMMGKDSASAPEFFEHHGFVDKIWSDWEKKGDEYKFNTYFMEINEVMPNTSYLPRDFLDLQNMPGGVCVEYEDPQSDAYKDIKGLSLEELQNISRLPPPEISLKAAKLFSVPMSEISRLSELRKKLQPKRFVQKSELKGVDAKLGFKLSDVKKARAAAKKSGRLYV